MPRIHPRVYSRVLYPSFAVPHDSPSAKTCVSCRRNIVRQCDKTRCPCKACVYCSEECKSNDLSIHEGMCKIIREMSEGVTETASRLEQRLAHFGETLAENYPENLYELGVAEKDRNLCQSFTKSYFFSRQALITTLATEGLLRKEGGDGTLQTNDLALDIAITHCKHLFILDKYDSYWSRADDLSPKKDLLMNLLLFTGRYEELYDLCCFFSRAGEKYFSHYSPRYRELICSPIHAWKEDVTKSFFSSNTLHRESLPVAALNHMFLIKQMLHERMEVLMSIDSRLHNVDCVSTIGEYLGVKREWLVFEKDWYKTQALEILSPFARCQATESEFGKLYGCSELFLACPEFRLVKDMMRTGARYIQTEPCEIQPFLRSGVHGSAYSDSNNTDSPPESNDSITIRIRGFDNDDVEFRVRKATPLGKTFRVYAMRLGFQSESLRYMHNGQLIVNTETSQMRGLEDGDAIDCFWLPTWNDTLRFCKFDHALITSEYIRPRFGAAVDKLNAIAGYDVISRNIDHYKIAGSDPDLQLPEFSFTRFVADALNVCHKHLVSFDDFVAFMDGCDEGEMQMQYVRPYDFTYGLMAALVLERKMARASLYVSLVNGKADPILEILSEEDGDRLRRMHPPPFEQNDPFLTFPLRYFTHTLTPDISDRIQLVSKWMSDVTDVIKSLFDADLATPKHLSEIFGHSSLVSNTIWELEQAKLKRNQRSITSMMSNNVAWKQGCVMFDPTSGLKIKYLTLQERKKLYDESGALKLLAEERQHSATDEGEDRARYLLRPARVDSLLRLLSQQREVANTVGQKPLKDAGDNVKEPKEVKGSREATYDRFGIPRLLILNGSEKNLWKSGWKWVGENCRIGDKTVQVGSRVALAVDDAKCSHCRQRNFWAE